MKQGKPIDAVGDGLHRMTVGLRPLAESEWIDGGDDYYPQLVERARVLAAHPSVVAALPGTDAAQHEVLTLLAEHLQATRPSEYCWSAANERLTVQPLGKTFRISSDDARPFDTAAQIVPEDLCLMRADASGQYRLVAAALCFPTRWRLADKLGKPMLDIHAPVPGYASEIGAPVERVMAALKPARLLWRHNWSLLDSPVLHQPERPRVRPGDGATPLGGQLWLRSERQTLRRLPRSGDVLFTIRIRQSSLADACARPESAARLLGQLESMPADLLHYKGLEQSLPRVLDYLRTRARGSGDAPG